jgi:ribonuclease-3
MGRDGQGGVPVSALENSIGHRFMNERLAWEALTHASHSNERPGEVCNERLEFLGDAVLELIVSTHLFEAYPDMDEGSMTKVRAAVVSEPSLAAVAAEAGLPGLIRMGRGMERTGGRQNPSMLSDTVEAVIGALYLDGGIEAAQGFILPRLLPGIATAAEAGFLTDNKTRLQELLQRGGEVRIEYLPEGEEGAPHERIFTISLCVDGRKIATGQGRSKKEAQQVAAGNALNTLTNNPESGNNGIAPEKA